MKQIHSKELLATPPKPIQYLIQDFLPLGTHGDVSGMPDSGKSTILLSMAASISIGAPWFGLKASKTPSAWVTGEASGSDVLARDLHRLKVSGEADITFTLPDDVMFRWADDQWITTTEGRLVIDKLRAAVIGFVVLDTIGSLCAGLKEIDNDQQRQLARHVKSELNGITTQTISHTNQASAKEALSWRLHYLSRAGGNGFPGAQRWAAGVSRLQEQDADVIGIHKDEINNKKLIAIGVSKNNEAPTSCWTNFTPAIFEIKQDGALLLVKDGREVKAGKKSQTSNDNGGVNDEAWY